MFICGESVLNTVTVTRLMSLTLENLETADVEEADIPDPDEAGPALLGREPVVGSVRRKQGVTVIRDELKEELNL
jgi:hypothetical protein